MIEIIEEKPAPLEITPQLAKSGLRLFRDYCITQRQQPGKCNRCDMLPFCIDNFKKLPDKWEV